MSLRPTALALGGVTPDSMFVVIEDPEASGPLLIPCSWEHRRLDVSSEDLRGPGYELHHARDYELTGLLEAEVQRMRQEADECEEGVVADVLREQADRIEQLTEQMVGAV